MAPALQPGDLLVATRKARLKLGDLVVAEHPERPGYELVKRLAGLPGQAIAGQVLAPGEYWVVGDNPAASTDSRSFGPLSREKLKGVVVFRYWPWSRAGGLR